MITEDSNTNSTNIGELKNTPQETFDTIKDQCKIRLDKYYKEIEIANEKHNQWSRRFKSEYAHLLK